MAQSYSGDEGSQRWPWQEYLTERGRGDCRRAKQHAWNAGDGLRHDQLFSGQRSAARIAHDA